MKNFLKTTLGILSIWAILFAGTGILANWFLGAEYLFDIVCVLSFLFVIVGVFIGWRNTIKEAQQDSENK